MNSFKSKNSRGKTMWRPWRGSPGYLIANLFKITTMLIKREDYMNKHQKQSKFKNIHPIIQKAKSPSKDPNISIYIIPSQFLIVTLINSLGLVSMTSIEALIPLLRNKNFNFLDPLKLGFEKGHKLQIKGTHFFK